MARSIQDIPTESAMTLIEMRTEEARVLVQELLNDYFTKIDEAKAALDVAVDFHRVSVFIGIVEGLLIQIGDECKRWNDWYREAHERAKNKDA